MKTLITIIILSILIVSCATSNIPWQTQVATAEKEWAAFVATSYPGSIDVAAVQFEKQVYETIVKSGDKAAISRAAYKYIDLIYTLMIPPLPEGSIFNK